MTNQYPLSWDMSPFFGGESNSDKQKAFLHNVEGNIKILHNMLQEMNTEENRQQAASWVELLTGYQDTASQIKELSSFGSCMSAQDLGDQNAKLLVGSVRKVSADFASLRSRLEEVAQNVPQDQWEKLLASPSLKPLAFNLNEIREKAADKMAAELEILANDLSVSGYHAYPDLYNTIVGKMSIPYTQDGEEKQLSVSQAANMLLSTDPQVRTAMSEKWEEAWAHNADLFAHALNHLGGFRLALYRHRGWESVLREPVSGSRMTQETLDAMWEAINQGKDRMVEYLNRKAKLLGKEKLGWHDVSVPLGSSETKIPYDQAAHFIIDQFRQFSPKMADFAQRAFAEGWIEAEDRPGKRPGGFCANFPVSKQSRIFLTYGGTQSNVATIAHELGHAYHNFVTSDLPALTTAFAMNVAETASTFAEIIVADAALKLAKDDDERILLLEDKLERSVAFFMNIHARFIFEQDFYEHRKNGLVSVGTLNELMVSAQKEAFREALADYHPHFWAAKAHFYNTGVPFYNYPYTFGYLFSLSVYARALEEGTGFEDKYVELLRDTGRMTVEELAQKHLGADVTKTDFWSGGVRLVLEDVEQFLALTNDRV
ncbi:M3 family oligoendopeptidase [Brevibacillus dissolubilis]|uniref:M3 family oligoendopeptidase n=1 Tax=Brevibacillus dissolubilis TaxID=1844116 RepID=UPI00111699EB|nr:M3 family oligoendopeptidase [Brevibacillus dissolubilis]